MADGLKAIGNRRHFQYIVIGCGGIGSGTLYWLSKKAPGDVLGLEQFSLGHEKGGSQDFSRIIRLSYHDDRYTRLCPATFEAWAEVERESGLQLVYKTGGLLLADRGISDHILEEYAGSMQRNNVWFERLNSSQLKSRFPQFNPPTDMIAVYQKDSGLVDAALGNSTHLQLARSRRAVIIENCPVLGIRKLPDGNLEIRTTLAVFTCGRLIVTAGAWINNVLGCIGVHLPITVTQEQVTYYATPHVKDFTKDKFPVWIYYTPKFDFYGLPIHGNSGTKIGMDAAGPPVTGDTRTFVPDSSKVKTCTDMLEKILPKYVGPEMYTKTCLYTMPPDRDFIVDNCARYGYPNVIVCCGAGHAYKFASLLGKILSQLAVEGGTQYNISEFKIDRPALTDPTFKSMFQMGNTLSNDRSKL